MEFIHSNGGSGSDSNQFDDDNDFEMVRRDKHTLICGKDNEFTQKQQPKRNSKEIVTEEVKEILYAEMPFDWEIPAD